ncbi:O-antigen ligase family protein [Caldisalinibacter kiritimatiensis]|uniref:O-antigen polymerase n=1 Tax=Caldisalinibacter kiritimatiensis TaxID=1304284 RepID=R1CCT2_9FIRM|nr:O-antigen ligase family protein [Caldisalinibacter kiritimatiensis]EOD00100.1 hypothetical protein L21TH_1866 [Caldisalinibacter kiritimatiensis]
MPTKTLSSQQKTKSTIETLVFIGLCILLFYPPFFRGLYFEKELLPTHIFSFTLALIWIISKYKDKEYNLIKSPIDLLAIGVVFMYFISVFYGVNTRLAISEFLKYANYFVIFLLVRDLVNNDNRQKILLSIILFAGVIVSVIGIGSAIGTWSYKGAYVGNRINSTFQYPNTLASYLGALYIIALGYILTEENKLYKSLYGISAGVFLFTFILTYSRGMWLILPFMLLAYIIVVLNKRKLEAIIYTVLTIIASVPFSFMFSNNIEGKDYKLWFIFIIGGILSGALTYIVSLGTNTFRKVDIKKFIISLAILVIVLIGAFVFIFNSTTSLTLENNTGEDKWTVIFRNIENIEPNKEYELDLKYNAINKNEKPFSGRIRIYSVDTEGEIQSIKTIKISEVNKDNISIPFETIDTTHGLRIYFGNYYSGTSITHNEAILKDKETNEIINNIPLKYKYIPESIVSRFESISLKERSAEGRLTFYQDAFKIIKEHLLFGTGGGGWETLYQTYQSYGYNSTQAHNYFLQMWIEVGLIGLILFLGIVLFLTYYMYKSYKEINGTKHKIMINTIYIATVSILLHAFMDFDLSLSALTFVLWALFGILVKDIKLNNLNKRKNNSSIAFKFSYILVLVILIIISSSLKIGNVYALKALKAHKENNVEKVIEYFEKASAFDPYKIEYKNDLANYYKVKFKLTKDKESIIKAKELMDDVVKLSRYSSRFKALSASFYMSIGDIEKGLELVDKSVKIQPMQTRNYVQKCDAYLSAFYYYASQKKGMNNANEIIQRAYKVKKQINEVNQKALKPLKYNEDLLYKIGFIQFNYENLINKEYKIPNGYTLDFAYYFDLDINDDGNIDKLGTWSSKGGNVSYDVIEENNNNSFIRITNDGESYGIAYPYGLNMDPVTEYKIYFKARGTTKENTFRFYVFDNKAKKKNQGSLSNIKLNNDWKIYSLDITTDSDIKPGTQYLRFQHNGNDEGYIDIEEVLVFKKIQ